MFASLLVFFLFHTEVLGYDSGWIHATLWKTIRDGCKAFPLKVQTHLLTKYNHISLQSARHKTHVLQQTIFNLLLGELHLLLW